MNENKTESTAKVEKKTLFRSALAWIGLAPGSGRLVNVEVKNKFYLFVIAGFLAFISALAGASFYSTSPSFCNSCHIMDPYYNAWKTSSHNHVACVDCHYPPGETRTILWKKFQALSQVAKYVTRTYSPKPFAEIEDASCLRSGCHSERLLQGRVVSEKGVLFDHKPHLEEVRLGKQLRCVSCHSQIVVGNHMEVTWDTCYLCHFRGRMKNGREIEPIGGCRGCHMLPNKEIKRGNVTVMHKDLVSYGDVNCQACHRQARIGEGKVGQDRCFICHNEPDKIKRFGEIDFIHENHVTRHNTACFHCHEAIQHGLLIEKTSTLDFECSKCHMDTHDLEGDLYSGLGAKGVPEMPSPMFLAKVDCTGCHVKNIASPNVASHAQTFIGSEVGCANCHGTDYLGMVIDGQRAVDQILGILSQNYAKTAEILDKNELDPELAEKIEVKMDEALFNLEFLKKTHSAHNIYYAAESIRYADMIISAAAKRLDAPVKDTKDMDIISGAYCATMCHNRLGVETPQTMVTFNGKDMKHKLHIDNGLTCVVCHDLGMHKQVEFKGKKVCLKCHSEEDLP